ncbi:MAG: glycosyltransferase family 4 protein [Rhodanobacteraceae bacterium]|nr:glycosyltransferase family 4 protein [Rhodanobacteraceae bacterium]
MSTQVPFVEPHAQTRSIALAPRDDLHTGYHGAILAGPLDRHSLQVVDAEHLFLMRDGEHSPSECPHFIEAIRTKDPRQAVHSARWPVLDCAAWLTDMDDLLYPVLFGRTASNPRFVASARSDDPEMRMLLARRARTMLSAYLHPSCTTILFRGHPRKSPDVAREWFAHLGVADLGEAVLQKLTIVRPAQRAAKTDVVKDKWNSSDPLRVLFCGRDFDVKNGLLALEVMQRVRRDYESIAFTYVGPIPSEVVLAAPELLYGVTHHEHLPHDAMLIEMRKAHLYFHPSKHESIGIALLEAMGAGAAVVTARGEATEYSDELFDGGGALLLDRDKVSARDESFEFECLVRQALSDKTQLAELGMRNHRATDTGIFSIGCQATVLANAYDALFRRQGQFLTIDQLDPIERSWVRTLSERELRSDVQASRDRHRIPPGYQSILI